MSDADLPPAAELQCLRVGAPREIAELAEQLALAGVPCRVDAHPPGKPIRAPRRRSFGMGFDVGLYVRPAEAAAAEALLRDRLAARGAEVPTSAAAPGTELAACPACGHALDAGAAACSDCGLEFPGEE